jgi:ATP-dependent helicase/nuclease subunit B
VTRVEATAYGRPALESLATLIHEAKAGDRLTPVTVLVESNTAGVATRRALAGRPGGVAAVSVLTVARLAERLGAPRLGAQGCRPVSTPVLGVAVRAALAQDPGIFAEVANHPATESALVAATRELASCTRGALDALAACSPRACDVVRIARTVRDGLADRYYDEHHLLTAATAAVEEGADPGPVVLHLLQRIPPAAADFLAALTQRTTLAANVGLTGDEAADAPVVAAHARAGITVPVAAVPLSPAAAAISASDPDEEVRAAVRLVSAWMADGARLGRIALLYGARSPYARLVHEHLDAAGIPAVGTPVRTIGELTYGRTVRSLLSLEQHGWARTVVMGMLTGAPLRDTHGPVPTRAWERISRSAAVVAGDDWTVRLDGFASRQRSRADELDADDQAGLAARARAEADRADALRAFVEALQQRVRSLDGCGSWESMVAAVRALLEEHFGGPRFLARWPEGERRAAERVEEILDRLASLDELGGAPPTLDVFARTLDDELEASLPRSGHLGDGVLCGPVSAAVGLDLDRVVVLGLAEGVFPARRLEDSLLPDRERLVTAGQLDLRGERIHDDHRHLLAAIASGSETVLTHPRGDLRQRSDRPASRWLLDQAGLVAGHRIATTDELSGVAGGWSQQLPSYVAALQSTPTWATAQDLRLATMLAHGRESVEAVDPLLPRAFALAAARRSPDFTRFDGNLGLVDLPDLTTATLSATRLEAWASCPHAYLVRYVLGVEPVEEPGDDVEIDALTRGSIVHEILDRFVTEQIGSGGAAPWSPAATALLVAIGAEVFDDYAERGLTGHRVFSSRDRTRMLADLAEWARFDDGTPFGAEWRFDAAPYVLPDGQTLTFRGSVDRLDHMPGGTVRVTDYKTGKADRYSKLTEADPHNGGSHLQLAVYAAAVHADTGSADITTRYWFASSKGEWKSAGYPFTDDIRRRVAEALAVIADGITGGTFPLRPPKTPGYGYVDCWYCSPDGLSTSEVRRSWERKRSDPSLGAYATFVGDAHAG